MSAPQGTTGVPSTSPSIVPEGPIPAPSTTPAVTIPSSPAGNNSAPPGVSPTPPTKKEGITFHSLVVSIVSLIFMGYAIYYGWIMGQQHGQEYLLYVQSFGPWLRSWFTRN